MESKPLHKKLVKELKPTGVCLAISLALSANVFAQDSDEEVVVWGTQISSNSETLASEDMSIRQADHLSDLLRHIPGVDVGGTHSVNQRISIRGLGETDLDIRLDGASQHANMFHHIGNLTLNPDILKSADIQVGNNSVAQNGLGGSVHFETKDARDLLRYDQNFGVRVAGGLASNKNGQASLTAYGLINEQFDFMAYANLLKNGDFEDGDGNEGFGQKGDVRNTLFKFGFEPDYENRFEASFDFYKDEGDYNPRPDLNSGTNQKLTANDLIPTEYNRMTVTLGYELSGETTTGKVTAYATETEIKRNEGKITGRWPGNRKGINIAINKNTGLNAKFETIAQTGGISHRIVYGLDYMKKSTESSYVGVKYMDEGTTSAALFAENTFGFFDDKVELTAGMRLDDYKRNATHETTKYDEATWALGIEAAANESLSVFANTRTLFKGPELLETYISYQDVVDPTTDLKAETGQNSQAGLRFVNNAFTSNLTLFKTDIDDYIVETGYSNANNQWVYKFYNSGDVEINGLEVSGSYFVNDFSGKLSYTKSDIEYKDGTPVYGGNGRSMDEGDMITLGLNYNFTSFDTYVGFETTHVTEEDNVKPGQSVKDAYTVHNFYAQWTPQFAESLTVNFGIDNVFDEAYTSHASRSGVVRGGNAADDYEPGRNIKLSASYQF